MSISKEVGNKLKRARLRAGLTQQDLAKALDLQSKVSVHGYESGANQIPLDVLVRLPSILGCRITDLLPDSVVTDHERGPTLIYQYRNEPATVATETMHIHLGTCRMTLQEGDIIEGDYYTGKDRQTCGQLKVKRN